MSIKNSLPTWLPIFGSHVKRIGFLRVLVGAGSMYFGIPSFIVFHFICLYCFLHLIASPVLGIPKIKLEDYLSFDRYKASSLPWFDRFNCLYCDYANGIATFFKVKIDQVNACHGRPNLFGTLILTVGCLLYLPVSIITQIQRLVIYDFLVSRPLGLHRLSSREALLRIKHDGIGQHFHPFIRKIFINEVVWSMKLNNGLEQIETAWCPIKHFDVGPDFVHPKHHELFFDAHEIDKVKQAIQTDGTVSRRKPYW